ncbi:MAG TPA: type II secretion system F family protein [Methylocella sp.]|nr:type II secretion system F family protein [Methylocella sp.]
MNASELWSSVTFPDLMALSGIIALIVGGVALIASSIPMRSEVLARRINLALPRTAIATAGAARGAPPSAVLQLPALGAGLSEAEQRQVIRLFSNLGVPADRAVPYFIISRLILAGGLGVVTLVAAWHLAVFAASWWVPVAAAVVAAIAGWILPILFIAYVVRQRTKAVASGLPNALELLVVCVEAGLSLEDALQRVSHELRESQPALADELALTWAEVNILPNRNQALANLAERVDIPSVRSVVGMLSQSLRFGTPLAQSLRVGAMEMRNDQMTLLEERASRLPALMTIPVMLFIMPTIFLIIGGPAALRLIDTFVRGMH